MLPLRDFRFLVLLALLVSCSSSSTGDDETQATLSETFLEELVLIHCERMFSCCSAEGIERTFAGFEIETEADCVQVATSYVQVFVKPTIEESLALERLALSGGEVQACLTSLKSRSCEEFRPGLEPDAWLNLCPSYLSSNTALSGFCQRDAECSSGFCAREGAEGVCQAPPLVGDACAFDRCAEGYCEDEICRATLDAGESCSRNDMCSTENCSEFEGDGMMICRPIDRC